MFAKISENLKEDKGKGVNELTFKMQKHFFDFGRKEWQQEWKSDKQRNYSEKPVIVYLF